MRNILLLSILLLLLASCETIEIEDDYPYLNPDKPENNGELIINNKGEEGSIYKMTENNGILYQSGTKRNSTYFIRSIDTDGNILWENEYNDYISSFDVFSANNKNYVFLSVERSVSSTRNNGSLEYNDYYFDLNLVNADTGLLLAEKKINLINEKLNVFIKKIQLSSQENTSSNKLDFVFSGSYEDIIDDQTDIYKGLIGSLSIDISNNSFYNNITLLKSFETSFFRDFVFVQENENNRDDIICLNKNKLLYFENLDLYNNVFTIKSVSNRSELSVPDNGKGNKYKINGSLLSYYENGKTTKLFLVGRTYQNKQNSGNDNTDWSVGKVTSVFFDNDFRLLWDKEYSFTSHSDVFNNAILDTDSNRIAICGDSGSYVMTNTRRNFGNASLTIIDSNNGNVISHKTFGSDRYDSGFNTIIDYNGKYFLGGYTDNYLDIGSDSGIKEPNWLIDFKTGSFNQWFTAISK